jgi:hypothetical protein
MNNMLGIRELMMYCVAYNNGQDEKFAAPA